MTNSKYGRILAVATTVCAILLGVLFIICCAHLYFTGGEQPYSRESVGAYLKILAIPSFITVALAIWGIGFNFATGEKDEQLTKRTSSDLLESFASRYDIESFDEETIALVSAERKNRKIVNAVVYSTSALIFVLVLAYLVFVAEFTVENLNANVMAAFTLVLPLSAIAVALHIPRIYLVENSFAKELELLKASVKNHGAPKAKVVEKNNESKVDYTAVARYVIVGAAIALVILGITNGGMTDVLQKAVKICTECIGLG